MKIDQSWYEKPEGVKERSVAGGVVVRKDGDKIWILLLKVGNFDHYDLPKGGVQPGESIQDASKREIKEESGISDLKLIGEIGITERLTFEKDFWSICHYFLFMTNQIEGSQELQDGEDYSVKWFEINKLPSFFWPDQEKIIKNNLEKIKASILIEI